MRLTGGEWRPSHSAVFDSKALTLAVSLSFPICSKGMRRTGPHVAMSAAWSLAGWLTSVVCGQSGGVYDDHVVIHQGLWGRVEVAVQASI